MTDEYMKAFRAGEKEYKAKLAAGEYPYLPALDDIAPDVDLLTHKALGIMEIPVELIAGTKTRARQNSFAANFMPLLEPDTEFASKWDNLYKAQIREGFNDPVKVYEYLHRFYVQEGNKRVSVSHFLDMPTIAADVIRVVPSPEVLEQNPAYEEFLRFYNVAPIYDIEMSWTGAYAEIAELLGTDLETSWPEDLVKSLRNTYWLFSRTWASLEGKLPDIPAGDAFMVYLRIYIKDALRHQPPSVISKRLIRIKKELLTEQNKDRVALVEAAEDAVNAGGIMTKAGNLVAGPVSLIGKVIPAVTYSAKNPLKAAFIYDKTIEGSPATADHEKGRIRLEKAYGGIVETRCYEACAAREAFEAAVSDAAEWGADVVFTTSPAQINDTLRAAIEYENIKFLNCSVNLAHQAVRTYYAKLYEAKFLAGLVAGAASAADGTHAIGYCSDYPIYGTIAAINAFAIGAAMADPEVKIYLEWESRRDADWWWSMVDKGIHVISATDSMHSADGSAAYGVCHVERCAPGEGNDLSGSCRITNLAVPIYKWGKLYETIVKTIIEGTYHASLVDKKDQATNYWWGMISGVVDIELSDSLSSYTKQLVGVLRQDIIDGRFNPFDGELRSREGLIRGGDDEPLSSRDIILMDWLNENIIGEIPKIDELSDDAKTTVKYSGVEKAKKTDA